MEQHQVIKLRLNRLGINVLLIQILNLFIKYNLEKLGMQSHLITVKYIDIDIYST